MEPSQCADVCVSSLSQAEAREGLHGVLPGLAPVREAAGLHGHGGSPGPAGRTRHLQHHGQRKGRHSLGIQRRKHQGPVFTVAPFTPRNLPFSKKSVSMKPASKMLAFGRNG